MALTGNCDIFASLSENAINAVVRNVSRQRPSMFNYGTSSFLANPELMCRPIELAANLPANQPADARVESRFRARAAPGASILCAADQTEIDFHPGQLVRLPPELQPPLKAQRLALPGPGLRRHRLPLTEDHRRHRRQGSRPLHDHRSCSLPPGPRNRQHAPQRAPRPPTDRERIDCFCLDVFAAALIRRDRQRQARHWQSSSRPGARRPSRRPRRQHRMPSVDYRLHWGASAVRISIQDIILSLGTYGSLTIGLTPTSAQVPFNPSIANDEFSVLVSVS